MEHFFDTQFLQEKYLEFQSWLFSDVLVLSTLGQLGVVVVAYLAARLLAPRLGAGLKRVRISETLDKGLRKFFQALSPLGLPLIWLAIQWGSVMVAVQAQWPHNLIRTTVSLLTAWAIIRLASQLVREAFWARFIAFVAWSVAALNIVGLLDETIVLLDSLAVQLGDLRLSAFTLLKVVFFLVLLLWLAVAGSNLLEQRIRTIPNLTPAIRVLFSKILKILLIVIAVVAALKTVGIDLTAFAVLSGAIGVGIGFGLQKAVSNLISGVMLLLDKSIKPGDVVSVGDTFGWVSSLGARYVSLITRDGIEYLIPNEDFITKGVENWSYSNNLVRLKVPIGIAYSSDVRKARALCLDVAAAVPRVLGDPTPVCHVVGFGDNSVNLELRFWINDPPNGLANVKSEVLLGVWDRFRENGIEIPFPQRDLHLKPPADINVHIRSDGEPHVAP